MWLGVLVESFVDYRSRGEDVLYQSAPATAVMLHFSNKVSSRFSFSHIKRACHHCQENLKEGKTGLPDMVVADAVVGLLSASLDTIQLDVYQSTATQPLLHAIHL